MQRHIAFLMTLWSVTSCQSVGGRGADESPIWSLAPVESQVESWVDYMAELEGMNPRELKSEADRARRLCNRIRPRIIKKRQSWPSKSRNVPSFRQNSKHG
jgi:hypothetical protein